MDSKADYNSLDAFKSIVPAVTYFIIAPKFDRSAHIVNKLSTKEERYVCLKYNIIAKMYIKQTKAPFRY